MYIQIFPEPCPNTPALMILAFTLFCTPVSTFVQKPLEAKFMGQRECACTFGIMKVTSALLSVGFAPVYSAPPGYALLEQAPRSRSAGGALGTQPSPSKAAQGSGISCTPTFSLPRKFPDVSLPCQGEEDAFPDERWESVCVLADCKGILQLEELVVEAGPRLRLNINGEIEHSLCISSVLC